MARVAKPGSLLSLSAPPLLFPEGTFFCPLTSTPKCGDWKFLLSDKCHKVLENVLVFRDITKTVRMLGLYFLHNWSLGD